MRYKVSNGTYHYVPYGCKFQRDKRHRPSKKKKDSYLFHVVLDGDFPSSHYDDAFLKMQHPTKTARDFIDDFEGWYHCDKDWRKEGNCDIHEECGFVIGSVEMLAKYMHPFGWSMKEIPTPEEFDEEIDLSEYAHFEDAV